MPEPQKSEATNQDKVPDVPVRELTQTDHLNKKLLTSLFKRMDDGAESQLNKMLEPDDKTDDVDEWQD